MWRRELARPLAAQLPDIQLEILSSIDRVTRIPIPAGSVWRSGLWGETQ
jgi:hypothetical protein